MTSRRVLFLALAAAIAAGLTVLLACALLADGATPLRLALLLCFAGLAPWSGISAANALLGFSILRTARDPLHVVFPIEYLRANAGPLPRTAIAVTVRDENMDAVLPPLGRLLAGLAAAGHGEAFALF